MCISFSNVLPTNTSTCWYVGGKKVSLSKLSLLMFTVKTLSINCGVAYQHQGVSTRGNQIPRGSAGGGGARQRRVSVLVAQNDKKNGTSFRNAESGMRAERQVGAVLANKV